MLSFYLPPSFFEIVTLKGVDAAKFLQGQLTCDVNALDETGYSFGAICNNKGRVITPFIIFKQAESFHLLFSQGLSALFIASLKKYQPFYKCEMYLDESMACLAVVGSDLSTANRENLESGALLTINTELKQFIYCLDKTQIQKRIQEYAGQANVGSASDWQISLMQAGHYPFAVTDSELFTPQDLHYNQKGYISFSKGCYTGQEIVARMHYRGKIKNQLFLASLAMPETMDAPESLDLLDEAGARVASASKIVISQNNTLFLLAILPADTPDNTQFSTALGAISKLRVL